MLEFAEVYVTTFTINVSGGEALPEETVEFTFKKYVKFRYQPQTLAGHGAANIKGWSVSTGEPL